MLVLASEAAAAMQGQDSPAGLQEPWGKPENHLEMVGKLHIYVGVSENRVPLNPMVNDHYPY